MDHNNQRPEIPEVNNQANNSNHSQSQYSISAAASQNSIGPKPHEISRVVQVQLPDLDSHQEINSQSNYLRSGGGGQGVRFLAHFSCACCPERMEWLTRLQIIAMSSFPENRLKQLEDTAIKERREMETRQNAEELHKYLDFADIDWDNLKDTDFEKVKFSRNNSHKKLADCKIYEEILTQEGNFSFGSANLKPA